MNRVEKLQEFLAQSPGDSFLQHALALEYIKAGRDDEARTLFESVLQQDPGYVGSYYHLGKLLERIAGAHEAIPVYKKGIDIAKAAGDRHSQSELQAALDDLEDD